MAKKITKELQKSMNSVAPYLLALTGVAIGLDQGIEAIDKVIPLHDSLEKACFWGGLGLFSWNVLRPVYQQGLPNFLKAIGDFVYQTINKTEKSFFNYTDETELEISRSLWKQDSIRRNIKSVAIGAGLVGLLTSPVAKGAAINAYNRAENDVHDWISATDDARKGNTEHKLFLKPKNETSVLYQHRDYDLTAEEIEIILAEANSPMQGQGKHILQCAKKYDLRPEAFLAFAQMDSSMGTKGIGARSYNPTNIRPSTNHLWSCDDISISSSSGKFCNYHSWDRGIEAWFQLINKNYIGKNKTTVEAILPNFAPSSENNTQKYIDFVTDYMNNVK